MVDNADGAGDAVYAYDLATGERLEQREFELDNANLAPRGLWSDPSTIWISDSGKDKLFAHDLASGERLPDSDLALHPDNNDPRGIWSDGSTMWVLGDHDDAPFGYDLATGELVARHALDSANDDPRGLWSDRVTVWVSNHDPKRLFAYRLEDGELVRNSDGEFGDLSRASNSSPRGLWSDGDVMYVADKSDDKVYTYNMPDAIDARLTSLTLSGIDIGEFLPGRTEYEGVVAEGVTETTVEAEPAQDDAGAPTHPPDANEEADGHQVALDGVSEITVTVTSADGSRERVYRVGLGDPERAATSEPGFGCFRGDVAVGFSLLVYAGAASRIWRLARGTGTSWPSTRCTAASTSPTSSKRPSS